MARRSEVMRPARRACAGLALLVGLSAGLAAAPEEAGAPLFRIELRAVMQPGKESPVLLTTVPEPDAPTAR